MAAPSHGILNMTSETGNRAETQTGARAGSDNRVSGSTRRGKQMGIIGRGPTTVGWLSN